MFLVDGYENQFWDDGNGDGGEGCESAKNPIFGYSV